MARTTPSALACACSVALLTLLGACSKTTGVGGTAGEATDITAKSNAGSSGAPARIAYLLVKRELEGLQSIS